MSCLAGYSSAIVLAMIALLIEYEAVSRFPNPIAISFNEAIPIAVLGLAVNAVSHSLCPGYRTGVERSGVAADSRTGSAGGRRAARH